VDLVNELRPLEALRVAQGPFAKVMQRRGALVTVTEQHWSARKQKAAGRARVKRGF
jgi:hypothetical protein